MLLNTHRMTSQSVDITTQLKIASTKLHAVRIVGQSQSAERRSECCRYIFDIVDRKIGLRSFLDIEYVERCIHIE